MVFMWRPALALTAIINSIAIYVSISIPQDAALEDLTVAPTNLRGLENKAFPAKRALEENNIITGAFADCKEHKVTTGTPHPDQKEITLSCNTFPYRIPTVKTSDDIVIGVLSGAGGDGLRRRMAIRETWARHHSVFFIVAGPWENIQAEYDEFQDLIWLDQEENYFSGLTFKTMTFMKIAHDLAADENLNIQFAFKTDDDSFVNVPFLNKYLLHTKHEKEIDYWGKCSDIYFKPSRDPSFKWSISEEMYPEEYYPKYCQGAGFALSRKFLDCAAGPDDHLGNIRFMPFEDTAVGLLAERCGIEPVTTSGNRMLNQFRTPLKEERYRVKHSRPKLETSKLTAPDMQGRIVQHRIYDSWDMEEHFKQASSPILYKKSTTFKWYKPKYKEIYRWNEDTELNPNAIKKAVKKALRKK